MRARLDVFQNESGSEGGDFIVKTNAGNYRELYLQSCVRDRSKLPCTDSPNRRDTP